MVEIFVEITYNEWVDDSTCCISTAESRAPSLKQLFGQKAQRNRRVAGTHYLTADPDPTFHFNINPYPHQSYANLRPLLLFNF